MKNKYFAYRSFWPELETMKKMKEADCHTICFFAANTRNSLGEPYCKYPPMWLWHDVYDFSPLDRQIEDILSVLPDAELICIADLNTPEWLVKNLERGGGIYDSFNELGRVCCSTMWRDMTGKFLSAFIKYAESKYSGRIKAYVLACGMTCEWMDCSRGTESPERTAAFQAWCRQRHVSPQPRDIPPPSLRNHFEHDNVLRDPEKDHLALLYSEFSAESVADTIQYFMKLCRTLILPETELGVFYGYILEEYVINTGALAYERVLDIPELDFLISPGTYTDRAMGCGGGFMVPHGTIKLKGKSFLHECDQRTHTYNSNLTAHVSLKTEQWRDEQETLAGLKREMALALIKQTSLWWFDMWGDIIRSRLSLTTFA